MAENLAGWTPGRALAARRAAVHAWEEAAAAGAPPGERQALWGNVEYALDREQQVAGLEDEQRQVGYLNALLAAEGCETRFDMPGGLAEPEAEAEG